MSPCEPPDTTATQKEASAPDLPEGVPPLRSFYIYLSDSCNMRCRHCWIEPQFIKGKPDPGHFVDPDLLHDAVLEAKSLGLHAAKLTGGEPMLQSSVHELFRGLLEKDYEVLLETGGHKSLKDVDPRVHKIMDLKCPSSGMDNHNDYKNIRYLNSGDELKFVIGDRADFDWACDMIGRYEEALQVGDIHFSPVHGKMPFEDLARWILSSGLSVRLQLQMHKIIWPGIDRGR